MTMYGGAVVVPDVVDGQNVGMAESRGRARFWARNRRKRFVSPTSAAGSTLMATSRPRRESCAKVHPRPCRPPLAATQSRKHRVALPGSSGHGSILLLLHLSRATNKKGGTSLPGSSRLRVSPAPRLGLLLGRRLRLFFAFSASAFAFAAASSCAYCLILSMYSGYRLSLPPSVALNGRLCACCKLLVHRAERERPGPSRAACRRARPPIRTRCLVPCWRSDSNPRCAFGPSALRGRSDRRRSRTSS